VNFPSVPVVPSNSTLLTSKVALETCAAPADGLVQIVAIPNKPMLFVPKIITKCLSPEVGVKEVAASSSIATDLHSKG